MISFLNPFFLWFGLSLLIPLALHMIQSSRTVRLQFSTIRFIKLAEKRSSRRIKMENFILWVLRTLLMALLTLAFMMPMIRTKEFGNMLGRAARDVAIVIDASYSMDYKAGRRTTWDEAIETAAAIIEGLSDKDRFCVYLAREQPMPIYEQLTGEREAGAARVKALKLGVGSSQLCPAVMAANTALEQETRRVEREIHIISDNQALPWAQFKREGTTPDAATNAPALAVTASNAPTSAPDALWDPSKINDRTTCFVTLLGATAPENVSPVNMELEPKLITAETPCRLTVRLSRTGPPQETAVTVYVDEKEVVRRSVLAGEGTSTEIQFMIPPVGPGSHAVRIATPDDSLPVDNTFHFLIRAKQKLPTLCAGTKESTLFLRAALGAGINGVSPFDIKFIQPDQLQGEAFQAYVCVFLCNAIPLPGQDLGRLEQYVKGGGVLVIFPGDGAAPSDYGAWSCMPAQPSALFDVPQDKRKRVLNWAKPSHPMLVSLKEGGAPPSLAIKRLLKCEKREDRTETLITTGENDPFLLERPFGRGAVLQFTVAADRSWSDFPLSPFYLPVMHQLVQYSAGAGTFTPFLWTTESLPLQEYLPEATKDSIIRDPDANPVSIRTAMMDGQVSLHVEGLTKPGIYTLQDPQDVEPHPALAMNMTRAESDLVPVKAEDVPAILGIKNLQMAASREELLRKIEDFRIGKTLGEQMLWLALLIAIVESFYSNWLRRKKPKLTDSLVMDPSGKLAGK